MLKKLSVLAGTAVLAMSLMLLSGCGGDIVPTGGNGETTGSADGTTTTASLTGATDPADTTEEETTTTSGDMWERRKPLWTFCVPVVWIG